MTQSDPEWFVFELTVRAALRQGVGLEEATGEQAGRRDPARAGSLGGEPWN